MAAQFTEHQYSLFKVPEEAINHYKIMELEEGMWDIDAIFSATKILLQKVEYRRAYPYIELALRESPDNVHAWCAKGVYHLMSDPPEYGKVEEAGAKVRQLLEQERTQNLAAGIRAYWLACQCQRELLDDAIQICNTLVCHDGELATLCVMVLMKKAQYTSKNKEQWLPTIFQKLLELLTILATSEQIIHRLEMWSNLATIQTDPFCEKMMSDGALDLARLKQLTGSEKLDIEFCVNQMLYIKCSNPREITIRSNFCVKIGKLYHMKAKGERIKDKREELLGLALEVGEKYKDTKASCVERGQRLCAQVLLELWAIKFYAENGSQRDGDQEYAGTVWGRLDVEIWNRLASEYYTKIPDRSPMTRPLLERARLHLEKHVKTQKDIFAPELPRILLLLGERYDAVDEVFQEMKCCADKASVHKVYDHYGRFLELFDQTSKAIDIYRLALRLGKQYSQDTRYLMANNGLQRCRGAKSAESRW